MTREFSFKLAYLMTSVIVAMCTSLSVFIWIKRGEPWSLMTIPLVVLLYILASYYLGRGPHVLPFFKQVELLSPILFKVERFYFYSYTLFLSISILTIGMFFLTVIDIPVSYGLSCLGQYEMAEYAHRFNSGWGGALSKFSIADLSESFNFKPVKLDSERQEKAVLSVYGENSIQYGNLLLGSAFDCKPTDISKKRQLYAGAMKALNFSNDLPSYLFAKLRFAQLEIKANNLANAKKLISEVESLVDASKNPATDANFDIYVLEELASDFHLLGEHKKEKSMDKIVEQMENAKKKDFFGTYNFKRFVELRMAALTVIMCLISLPLACLYGALVEYLCWKNKKIARTSRDPEEILFALNFLIPLSLAKRKQKLADEYSKQLLELVQRLA